MGDVDGLGLLHVGVAGHEGVAVFQGLAVHGLLEDGDGLRQVLGAAAHVELEVGGDLVVAAAAGVQLPAQGPDALGEDALHGHVDVLVPGPEEVGAPLEVGQHALEAQDHPGELAGGKHIGSTEALGVGDASLDVLPEQLAIEGKAHGKPLHGRGHAPLEPSLPELVPGLACLRLAFTGHHVPLPSVRRSAGRTQIS